LKLDTEVLIVGAGPTGLMLACQLARFGISFRLIDKQTDRTYESRAFGIQAKSMEIFQNLGIVNHFLKKAQVANQVSFYFKGKFKVELSFQGLNLKDTPFPSFFLLPQSDTEQILLDYLKKRHFQVERQTELLSFSQEKSTIEAYIKNHLTGEKEKIRCRYLVGCDGAHSTVRHILDIPFVGAAYEQEFLLADVAIKWPFPKSNFTAFMSKAGILIYIPLRSNLSRLIIFDMHNALLSSENLPPLKKIEEFGQHITGKDFQLLYSVWISRFYLHHRAVQEYQKGLAFLAGDAAHIHSPIGAQGMNTGLQDATNLAWKMALTLKYGSPKELLETYQAERQRIGEILVKTTDRIFGIVITKNPIISLARQYLMPIVMRFLAKSIYLRKRIFGFVSELNIHYHENPFIIEKIVDADTKFLAAPKAGYRAPDAPIAHTSLFELLKKKPFNILLFCTQDLPHPAQKAQINELKKIAPKILAVHKFNQPQELKQLYNRYGITESGSYAIRPDGYIGFRSFGSDFESLVDYLHKIFGHK
jgi:2-polyprenyl-6-methoxyphenol hydroxylase-like FAD-dependent oxidoreductase